MVACNRPRDPIGRSWLGEMPWPTVPRVGDEIRVPPNGVTSSHLITASRVIFETDGTVYLVSAPVDDNFLERLRLKHGWRTRTDEY